MDTIFSYDPNLDFEFSGTAKYSVGTYALQMSATTLAGRKNPDSPQKPNEDAFSIKIIDSTLLAAVFDGTSSLKPISSLKDETGARFASHFLKKAFEAMVQTQKPKEIIREINKLLLDQSLKFEGTSLLDTHTLPASTATIAQIDPAKKFVNISHVGDSFCIVFYKDGHSKLVTIDKNKAYDDKVLNFIKQIAVEKHISPREARQDERVKQALLDMFQDSFNRADGTGQGIINGDPNAEQYVQDISLPLESLEAIFLGTDGIIPPGLDEQNEEDRQKIYNILKTGGLEELIKVKRDTEDNDPDWNLVRYKHSDDATGIFIEMYKR